MSIPLHPTQPLLRFSSLVVVLILHSLSSTHLSAQPTTSDSGTILTRSRVVYLDSLPSPHPSKGYRTKLISFDPLSFIGVADISPVFNLYLHKGVSERLIGGVGFLYWHSIGNETSGFGIHPELLYSVMGKTYNGFLIGVGANLDFLSYDVGIPGRPYPIEENSLTPRIFLGYTLPLWESGLLLQLFAGGEFAFSPLSAPVTGIFADREGIQLWGSLRFGYSF